MSRRIRFVSIAMDQDIFLGSVLKLNKEAEAEMVEEEEMEEEEEETGEEEVMEEEEEEEEQLELVIIVISQVILHVIVLRPIKEAEVEAEAEAEEATGKASSLHVMSVINLDILLENVPTALPISEQTL